MVWAENVMALRTLPRRAESRFPAMAWMPQHAQGAKVFCFFSSEKKIFCLSSCQTGRHAILISPVHAQSFLENGWLC
jgi:hypothetical protein